MSTSNLAPEKQRTRYMRCFTADGQKHVDIRIADESATDRHYVLLAAHVLTARNQRIEEDVEYDHYALISKDGYGSIAMAENSFVGLDRRGNVLTFDVDFNIIDRHHEPIITRGTAKMMLRDLNEVLGINDKDQDPTIDIKQLFTPLLSE